MVANATCRKDYGNAANAYAEAIKEAQSAQLTTAEDGDILGTLWSNEAFALLRSGDYPKAKASCEAALACASALPDKVREKAEARLKLAKAGIKLLRGQMGRSTYQPTVPDSWFAQDPDSDIVRMCWGWRTELEVAVRESKPARVAKLIAEHDFMEVRCFVESRTLVEKAAALGSLECVRLLVEEGGGDVDGMRQGCPDGWDECRRGGGYNGCTPLYGVSQGAAVAGGRQGGPVAPSRLEGRTNVASYLLEHGADPMAASDAGITPLFIACVNNAYPIVELMVASGRANVAARLHDGNTPLSVARSCVNDGFDDYRPLLALLEKELAAVGEVVAEAEGQLEVARSAKEAGNRDFKSGAHSEALACYRRTIELCKQVRRSAGAAAKETCEELLATASSNAAAACLHLGLSYEAERHCKAALACQPDHAKAKARLTASRKASNDYETKFLGPYEECKSEAATLAASGQFREATFAARRAVAMAAQVGDGLLEAKALLSLAEMRLAHALDAEDAGLAAEAREAANDLLAHCHEWEKRSGLSNSRKDESVLMAHLQSCEAMAWLFMARLDISAARDVAEGRRKLTGETLRLLKLVDERCPSEEMETSAYLAEANARQLIVQACTLLEEWEAAVDAADELVAFVEGFDVAFRCTHFCPFVVLAAECIADGVCDDFSATRLSVCTSACERLLRYAIKQAEERGELPMQAKWVRKLMNVSRSPRAYVSERDDEFTARLADELLGLLRRMGRRTDECAICLSPLDANDTSMPIDVLECLHCFHVACVREHVHRNAKVAEASDQAFANDVRRPGGQRMTYTLSGACPECRAPINLLAHAAE